MRSFVALTLLTGALFAGRPIAVAAQSCAPDEPMMAVSLGSSVGFLPSTTGMDIPGALSYWTGTCGNDGFEFPSLVVGSNADILISVQLINGRSTNSSGTCGQTTTNLNSNRRLIGGTIQLWTQEADGTACQVTDTLAHEMGHILGLDDAPECPGRIMGPQIGTQTRSVDGEDCQQANRGWMTPDEFERCGFPNCDDHGPCGV